MRLAAFNLENLFRRPKALAPHDWDVARPVLAAYAELQDVLSGLQYSTQDKVRIVELLEVLGLSRSDEGPYVILRRSRGSLLRRPSNGPVQVIVDGRSEWIGWLELKREAVDEAATRNTARVVHDVAADVLAVIEVEDRPALVRFVRDVLPLAVTHGRPSQTYEQAMLVDGNDERGIDVGVLARGRHPIRSMRSHVDDLGGNGEPVFSRDCPEFELQAGAGEPLLLLVNHFKSKGYGSATESDARRRAQALRVRDIYHQRRSEGRERIAVVGDLNDTPDSEPLHALLHATDLRDASEVDGFDWGPRRGTFGTRNDKIDYLLLSPELFGLAHAGGIFRKGVWRGPRVQDPWEMYDTITVEHEAASDHAAIWVDLRL